MSGTVQGIKELLAKFETHKMKSAKSFRIGLEKAGLFLQRESQKLVPIDTGALRASAHTRAEGEGFDTEVIVSYGGGTVGVEKRRERAEKKAAKAGKVSKWVHPSNYVVYVHENLEARHKPGKQAKFLEQPAREKQQRMGQIVAEAMRGSP